MKYYNICVSYINETNLDPIEESTKLASIKQSEATQQIYAARTQAQCFRYNTYTSNES